jgi:hypothetical protein
MALVQVDISSYDAFRAATMGNGYDIDGWYGYQCWDYCALLWGNIGRYGHSGTQYPYPYLQTGTGGYAYECWTQSRYQNAGTQFELIELLALVKKGDIVVLDRGRYAGDVAGHIAFADEDYTGGSTLRLVGQNQENPSASYGHVVTVDVMNVTKFLGAFRYKEWDNTPPTPTETKKRKRYPWAIYGRELHRAYVGDTMV